MGKIAEAGVAASWGELAKQVVDKTLEKPILANFPEVSGLIQGVKEKVSNVGNSVRVDDLLSGVHRKVAEVINEKKLLPNSEELNMAKQLEDIVLDLRRKLQFLKDYFDFQMEHFERCSQSGAQFFVSPSTRFTSVFPAHSVSHNVFRMRIRHDFDSTYRELAVRMGFPVVEKEEKPEGIRDLEADLVAVKSMFKPYLRPDEINGLNDLRGLTAGAIRKRIDAAVERGDEINLGILKGETLRSGGRRRDRAAETLAIKELAEIGHPWESFKGNITRLPPQYVLGKVRLMLELFGRIRLKLMFEKPEDLRSLAATEKAQGEERGEGRLQRFLQERQITQPPKYLKIGPERMMELIDEIEARGVPFQSEYWWWLNGTAMQRDAQIEETWRLSSRDSRRAELAEIYGFKVEEMTERAMRFEPDKIFEYCKVLVQIGHDVSEYWTVMNKVNPVGFRDEMIRRLEKKAKSCERLRRPGLSSKERLWLDKAVKVAELKNVVGDKIEGNPFEFVADNFTDDEIDKLMKVGVVSDVGRGLISQCLERFKNQQKLFEILRRYRFGYADFEDFTVTPEFTVDVLERIKLLERLKVPVTREHLVCDVGEVDPSFSGVDVDGLNEDQKKVFVYLQNVGCDDVLAGRLARNGESVDDFRAKIDYFSRLKLRLEDCGKEALELSDYADVLDRPLHLIKGGKGTGLRVVVFRVRNRYAEQKLIELFGENWRPPGHRMSPFETWQKVKVDPSFLERAVPAKTEIPMERGQNLKVLKSKFFAEYTGCARKFLDRDFDVFVNRFGIEENGLTLEELAKKWNVSFDKIRQIEFSVLTFVNENPEIIA